MRVVYIVGPYRSGTIRTIVENIRRAEAVALRYWRKGYAVICPHKNSELFDGAVSDEVILRGDIEFLKRSDQVVVLPGWERSEGSVGEVAVARELGIPIIYEELEVLEENVA